MGNLWRATIWSNGRLYKICFAPIHNCPLYTVAEIGFSDFTFATFVDLENTLKKYSQTKIQPEFKGPNVTYFNATQKQK